jgi:hypothetical protein
MMKREMTTEELWNEFRNELYPNGVPPALESDMKVAFHAGMMVAARFIIEATDERMEATLKELQNSGFEGVKGRVQVVLYGEDAPQ